MESSATNFVILLFMAVVLVVSGVFILSVLAKFLFPEVSFREVFADLFCFVKFFILFMVLVFFITGIGSVVIYAFMMIASGKPIF